MLDCIVVSNFCGAIYYGKTSVINPNYKRQTEMHPSEVSQDEMDFLSS